MNKANFLLDASLVDLSGANVGNFNRSTMMHLEREVEGSIQLYPIQAYAPAIDSESSAVLLEPVSYNAVTWNLDLTKTDWIKGSNVIIQPDECKAPDSSFLGDRVIWAPGNGATQLIQRTFALEAARQYTLSGLLRLQAGRFSISDVVRLSGEVIGTPSLSLSLLNNHLKRYRVIELSFTTGGRQPILPDPSIHTAADYTVTAVTSNSITISTAINTIVANQLTGGQVAFSNLAGQSFKILSNTGWSGNAVTIVLDVANLPGLGVSTTSRAMLKNAAAQVVTLEFYSESSAVVDWGGLQIEPLPFRSSMIYQKGELTTRAISTLSYRNSPIAELRTFGVFIELKFWRGDGNLFDAGNFVLSINQGRLSAQAGAVAIADPDPLPATNVEIFVQVAEETGTMSVYINSVLKSRAVISNFVADVNADLDLTSAGVRCIQRILTTDSLLLDGQPVIGGPATEEVGNLFSNPTVIDATAISAHAPLINLNPVTVPAKTPPTARSRIQGINTTSRILTLEAVSGFAIGQAVTVYRGEYFITRANITNVSGSDITLDTVAGIVINDVIFAGNVDQPGRISVRFPFDPIDNQTISSILVGSKRLTVNSTLAFNKGRAFIVSPLYQDKAEVLVENIDNTNGYLFVDNLTNIEVGDVITQPRNELIIDPDNYFAGLLTPVDGVQVGYRYSNGIVLENKNNFPVLMRPYIRVYL